MLDMKFLRNNPEIVKENIRKKFQDQKLPLVDEVIEFKHTAFSRSVFGKGAVEAAKFLAGKPAGMYDMSDVIQF